MLAATTGRRAQETPTGGAASRLPFADREAERDAGASAGSGSAHMTPPCSTMIWRARCRPTPAPDLSFRSVGSPVEKGWSNAWFAMPGRDLSPVRHGDDDAFVQRACEQLDRMSGGE